MRKRRFGFGRRRVRRTTMWIPALTWGSGTRRDSEGLTLVALAPPSSTKATAIRLTDDSDFQYAGGEGSVFTRARGQMYFGLARDNAGAPTRGFIRVGIVLATLDENNQTALPDLWRGPELGDETILWMGQTYIGPDDPTAAQTDAINDRHLPHAGWLEFDVRAKRRVAVGEHVLITVQAAIPARTGIVGDTITTMNVSGYLRVLMTRPR